MSTLNSSTKRSIESLRCHRRRTFLRDTSCENVCSVCRFDSAGSRLRRPPNPNRSPQSHATVNGRMSGMIPEYSLHDAATSIETQLHSTRNVGIEHEFVETAARRRATRHGKTGHFAEMAKAAAIAPNGTILVAPSPYSWQFMADSLLSAKR